MPSRNPTKPAALITIGVMFGITCVIALIRATTPWVVKRRITYKDYWLLVAFFFLISMTTINFLVIPIIYTISSPREGYGYQFFVDIRTTCKLVECSTLLHWATLWSVKSSLLALYKGLEIKTIGHYAMLWWTTVILTIITFLAAIAASLLSCDGNPLNLFVVGRCVRAINLEGVRISLYLGFGVDVATDLLIMIPPLFMVLKTKLLFKTKIAVSGVMCMGLLCIVTAIVRVLMVRIPTTDVLDTSGLLLWSLVEASIAVMIGCSAGIHEIRVKRHPVQPANGRHGTNDLESYRGSDKIKMGSLTTRNKSDSQERLTKQEESCG